MAKDDDRAVVFGKRGDCGAQDGMTLVAVHTRKRRGDIRREPAPVQRAGRTFACRVVSDFGLPVGVASGGLEVLALDVGERLEKDCPQLEVDRHVLVLRKVRETLCRRKIDLLHHVLAGKPLVENRVQPLFDKRQEAGAVFRERLGKALRRELVFHAVL